MNFVEAFEAPVIEKIGGVEISFPRLTIEDYGPWIAELEAEAKDRARKNMPRGIDPKTKLPALLDPVAESAIKQRIDNIECGLEDVAAKIWTFKGARRVLATSLTKAGMSPEDQEQILKRIKPLRLHALAAEVSALFEAKPPAEEGQSVPNQASPEANPAAPGATGSLT